MNTTKFKTMALFTALMLSIVSFPSLVYGQSVLAEGELGNRFHSIPAEKGMIISTREIRLKPEVDHQVFENWILTYWNPVWEDLIPEMHSFVSKKNPDEVGNNYAYYLIFKSKRIQKYNFDLADKNTEWYRELIYYEPTKQLYDELFEFIETEPFFNNLVWFEVQ